jgi:hypothetical protein
MTRPHDRADSSQLTFHAASRSMRDDVTDIMAIVAYGIDQLPHHRVHEIA